MTHDDFYGHLKEVFEQSIEQYLCPSRFEVEETLNLTKQVRQISYWCEMISSASDSPCGIYMGLDWEWDAPDDPLLQAAGITRSTPPKSADYLAGLPVEIWLRAEPSYSSSRFIERMLSTFARAV